MRGGGCPDATARNRKQQPVADYTTVGIIDVFGAIHIDDQRRQLLPAPMGRSRNYGTPIWENRYLV